MLLRDRSSLYTGIAGRKIKLRETICSLALKSCCSLLPICCTGLYYCQLKACTGIRSLYCTPANLNDFFMVAIEKIKGHTTCFVELYPLVSSVSITLAEQHSLNRLRLQIRYRPGTSHLNPRRSLLTGLGSTRGINSDGR